MNTLLIDTDVIYYQFAFRNQEDIDWDGDGETTPITFDAKCMAEVDEFLQNLKETLEADEMILVESSPKNFRKLLWEDYKAHRKDKPKPVLWQQIKDYLHWGDGNYRMAVMPWLEGDDALGILATDDSVENPIIVSIDKDMETIPCRLYLWNKPDLGVRTITPEQAHWNHMYQTLVSVVEAFESKGLTEEDALLQARMAYILRDGDDRYEYKKDLGRLVYSVRLWDPVYQVWKELPDVE